MTPEQLRQFILGLPGVVEGAHHGNADFRVGGKIAASFEQPGGKLTVKLTLERQAALVSLLDADVIALPGGWAKHGWTTFFIAHAPDALVHEVVRESVDALRPKSDEKTASRRTARRTSKRPGKIRK